MSVEETRRLSGGIFESEYQEAMRATSMLCISTSLITAMKYFSRGSRQATNRSSMITTSPRPAFWLRLRTWAA
jgi:hypothetical protein